MGRPRTADVEFIYEDDAIIAVHKPEGLPVIAPEGSRTLSLYDIVTAHIRRHNPKGRAALVHRIDRDTSGVVIFATRGSVKKTLMQGWQDLVRQRVYEAVIEGRLRGDDGVFDSWLVENRAGQVYTANRDTRGALRAVAQWKTLIPGDRYSLVELDLETGRKHQIRVQLADAGCPVAGDPRYGSHSDPLGRLCLHARLISLEHPATGELFTFESPTPESFRRLAAGTSRREENSSPPRGPHPHRR